MTPSACGRMVRGISPDTCDPQSELERLLNDPDVPMQAGRVWALAEKVAAEARTG